MPYFQSMAYLFNKMLTYNQPAVPKMKVQAKQLFTTPVPPHAEVVQKSHQGVNQQSGCTLIAGVLFVSFWTSKKKIIEIFLLLQQCFQFFPHQPTHRHYDHNQGSGDLLPGLNRFLLKRIFPFA